jgi:hypothetical protein
MQLSLVFDLLVCQSHRSLLRRNMVEEDMRQVSNWGSQDARQGGGGNRQNRGFGINDVGYLGCTARVLS